MANFFIIYVDRKPDATYDQLKTQMNLALDWYRIKENFWVVYSTSDAEKLWSRLSPLVRDGGNAFICKLDISDRQGWMNKSFWEWFRKDR